MPDRPEPTRDRAAPGLMMPNPTAANLPAPDLTALVGSRICHDLISPLGAIGNGVELLTMGGSLAGPEMALIAESVSSANARIRFFRVAFGAAGADQHVGLPEIRSILGDLLQGGRLAVDWVAQGSPTRGEVKMAFLIIQCLESAMPWGGRITVARQAGAMRAGWHITGEARRLKTDAELWAILSGAPAPSGLAPSAVQFALLAQESVRLERPLRIEETEGRIALSF